MLFQPCLCSKRWEKVSKDPRKQAFHFQNLFPGRCRPFSVLSPSCSNVTFTRTKLWSTYVYSYFAWTQLGMATAVMTFFNKDFAVSDGEIETSKKKLNAGTKDEVFPQTLQLLNALYRPYNERLAILLNDAKWIYNYT